MILMIHIVLKPATARAKTVVVVGLAQGTSCEDLETSNSMEL